METLPLTEARNRLSELVDDVQRTHQRVTITRHGEVAAVIMSADDLDALEETLEVLSSPELMGQLAESKIAREQGDVLDVDQLRSLMAEHRGE
ncbi:type II toxin-antitoxin system Phd/YefM family antitoxin [Spiractinospora alimapuensis]|uniref:type II toxin-antitoxin system Phd/YefM family antitoxin n=1 Tax=Spiractinospora alimapuensis TaxID=2820884 RepID=UPI001F30FA85|nr:type II toxin-antitoxin system Phd/YefM family antitoxin [Spiractinospora alimapuensis]QVQ52625.1 type II toxin-antitoxin system Phd/YefM family antitoxin [Spiractinospora alimapuensis]